jgi:hypothetical protein
MSPVHAPADSEIFIDKESRTAGRGTYPSDTLSTKNTIDNNPEMKPVLHIEKQMANHFRDYIIQCIFQAFGLWECLASVSVGTCLF